MNTINDYLDQIKEEYKLGSDSDLANKIGVTRGAISIIRHGGSVRNKTALKIADLLNIEPELVLVVATAERTKDSREKSAWERISKIITTSAADMLLFFMPFSDASAKNDETAFYTLCVVIKRWLKSLTLQPIHC